MGGHPDTKGMELFFSWLDSHKDMIETTPKGYINKLISAFTKDTDYQNMDPAKASRWLRMYRIKNNLTIKRLTQPYIKRSQRRSNYTDP